LGKEIGVPRKKTLLPAAEKAKSSGVTGEALLLFAFALLLRLLGIGWGLPNNQHYFSYHPDEVYVVSPALGMLEGDWNPHFFNYGTLYLYLIGLLAKILSGLGLAVGELGLLDLIARALTALLGAGTVLLVYVIGRQIGGRRLALLGALLLAVTPIHLINSHYATVDVPGTFFLALGGAASVQIIASGKWRWYLLAVAAAGLAAATKYPLGAGLLLPFGAHLLRGRVAASEHLKLITLLSFPLFFLAGCPYALTFAGGLQLRPEFLKDFLFEVRHMREIRTPGFLGTGSGWRYHALQGLPAGLGIPLYLLAFAGFLLALFRPFGQNHRIRQSSYFLFALWS
jgi:4-amino-4-deoxy-L-arabinose transferase-like glycosyltransferase